MQLERDVEGYLRRQVEKRGGKCYKFIPDIDNGMPDRIIVLPGGILVWVETKKGEGETARLLQQVQRRKLRSLGQRVEIAHAKGQVDALMHNL